MALSYSPVNPATEIDLIAIEREARMMQAKAIASMFGALRRGIVALFARRPVQRTA